MRNGRKPNHRPASIARSEGSRSSARQTPGALDIHKTTRPGSALGRFTVARKGRTDASPAGSAPFPEPSDSSWCRHFMAANASSRLREDASVHTLLHIAHLGIKDIPQRIAKKREPKDKGKDGNRRIHIRVPE
jgi:hypothetical protein